MSWKENDILVYSMTKYCKCSLQKNMKYGPYFLRMLRGHYRLRLSYSTNTGNFLDFYGRLIFANIYIYIFLLGYIEKRNTWLSYWVLYKLPLEKAYIWKYNFLEKLEIKSSYTEWRRTLYLWTMRFLGLILSSLLIRSFSEDVALLANCHSSSIFNQDPSDFQKAGY